MSLANVFALVAIFLVLLVWAWKSGKWASDIKNAIKDAADEASAAARTAAKAHEGIARLEEAIDALPCHDCPIVVRGVTRR
jgi:Flp pilus assembly protein TadG